MYDKVVRRRRSGPVPDFQHFAGPFCASWSRHFLISPVSARPGPGFSHFCGSQRVRVPNFCNFVGLYSSGSRILIFLRVPARPRPTFSNFSRTRFIIVSGPSPSDSRIKNYGSFFIILKK